jgi:hypothetical protein
MLLSKKTKSEIINKIVNYFKTSSISLSSIGIIIRSYHFTSPLILIMMLSLGNNLLVNISIICLITIIVMFILFNGCILSMLESKLCNDNFNIIDPTLEYFNMEINYINRMYVSYIIATIFIIAFILIYYYRFIVK